MSSPLGDTTLAISCNRALEKSFFPINSAVPLLTSWFRYFSSLANTQFDPNGQKKIGDGAETSIECLPKAASPSQTMRLGVISAL